jgi:hypothetical protein
MSKTHVETFVMGAHDEKATEHLEKAAEGSDISPALHLGIAGVHAVLAMADAIKHGLRDIIYELRD